MNKFSFKKQTNIFLCLLLIIILGSFLRIYNLGSTSFSGDEFLDINSTYGYFKTGEWKAWDFNFGKVSETNVIEERDNRAWIYKWQTAQIFKFFSPTEQNARLVSVGWGIISIILIYFFAIYFSKRKEIGLLSAFLFAVSIDAILFDRKFRMYSMFFPIFLSFSWLFYLFFEKAYTGSISWIKAIWNRFGINIVFLLPMLIVGALSFHIHELTLSIGFIFLVYAFIQALRNFKKDWKNKYTFSLVLIIFALIGFKIFSPDQFSFMFLRTTKFFANNYAYFGKIFSDYSYWMIPLFLFAFGIFHLIKIEKRINEGIWIATSFLATFFSAVFLWNRNEGDQYIFFVQSFEIILIASGIFGIALFFRENLKTWSKRIYWGIIIFALLGIPNYAYFFLSDNIYQHSLHSQQPNFKKTFTHILKNRKSEDVFITRNFRNYYFSGAKIPVFSFGGESAQKVFNLKDLQKIIQENNSGWIIYTNNDERYITKEARIYIEQNLTSVPQASEKDIMNVYRW